MSHALRHVMTHPYSVHQFDSWAAFRNAVSSPRFRSWAFRGQAEDHWPLYSALSRYLLAFGVHPDAWYKQERRMLRIFRRKAHLLLDHLPDDQDSFAWLALMQHHGAPTRLLDFSWSPFVASFFALERATGEAAVWALFPPQMTRWRSDPDADLGPADAPVVGPWIPGAYEEHFLPNRHAVAVIGEPHRMNQRLVAQGGTFVMPGVLDRPVEALVPTTAVVKFVLDARRVRDEAMAELYSMNINSATLFPGLDGLARSLAYELEHHWAFDPKTMQSRQGFGDG